MYGLFLQFVCVLGWLLSCAYAHTIEHSTELGNQRHLCIMADLTSQEIADRKFASCAAQLCSELNSQAAPIIVTKTTWQTALKYAGEKNQELLTHWDIYSYNNFLLLFIPHIYKKKCNARTAQDLGLNLDLCTKIHNPLLLYTPGFLQSCIDYVYHTFTNDIVLRNIVIPYCSSRFLRALQALILPKKTADYKWNILFTGHGLTATFLLSTICGIDSTHFKKFLRFLNTELTTRVLVYETCFGGAQKLLIDIYKTGDIPDIYNFPIICTCLTDAPAYYCYRIKNDSLFNYIHKIALDPVAPAMLIDAVHASTALYELTKENTKKIGGYTFNNCPQIRWTRASSFSVAPIDTLVTPLSHMITRESTCLAVQTPGLIIDQPVVPYTIVLTLGEEHRIASSIPGPARHALCKLSMPQNFKPYMLIKLFSKTVRKLATPKLFLIDTVEYPAHDTLNKITHITQVLIFINSTTPQTHRHQAVDELFYIKDSTGYCVRYKKNTYTIKTVSPSVTKKYLRIFNQEKSRLLSEN